MPHPFIVLGIDIDDTIITSKVRSRIQFIGDKNNWIRAIKELGEYCQERGVTLIPQLITAKDDGNTDSTVDAIMGQMKEVFTPLDSNGQSRDLRSPHQYIATRHISSGKIMNAFNNLDPSVRHPRDRSVAPLPLQEEERATISPVHVVQGNYNGQTSKAHVLHHISTFLGGVDQGNVFLIDDADYNEANLRDRCGDSSVGQYQFIQAGQPGVIETFVCAVKKRADEIATVRVEVETEQQIFLPPLKSTYYKYHAASSNKGRQHEFEVKIEDFPTIINQTFKDKYGQQKGDFLKSNILLEFKDKIEKTSSVAELRDLVKQLKTSDGYKVISMGQGQFTRTLGLDTSSVKAFQQMVKVQENNIIEAEQRSGLASK